MKKAILLGASGLIGGHILELLLADDRYDKVVSVARKELQLDHKKLKQVKGDLFDMSSFEAEFQDGDDLFIAIGTTKAKTPDKEKYEAIDYGIPVDAAKLAVEKSITNVAVVSSMGANPRSKIFYSALKGRMEEAIADLPIKNLNVVRPSLLLGDRNENRLGERFSAFVMTKLSFLIPDKHKAIEGRDVAKAMIVLSNQQNDKQVWLNEELKDLAKKHGN